MFPLAGSEVNNPIKLQVEGYNQDGQLVGGVEMQLLIVPPERIYLPAVMRGNSTGTVQDAFSEERRPTLLGSLLWAPVLVLGSFGLLYRRFHLG